MTQENNQGEKSSSFTIFDFACVVLLMGLVFTTMAYFRQAEIRKFRAEGMPAAGVVAKKFKQKDNYYIVVNFRHPQTKQMVTSRDIYLGLMLWSSLKKGDSVQVLYLKDTPKEATIDKALDSRNWSFVYGYTLGFVLLGCGLVLMVIGLKWNREIL